MRRFFIAVGGALIAAACSSQKPAAKLDEAGLSRLNESQMEPVDEARVEEGRARDALARARAGEADSRARLEVAKTERGVADAQLKRALAERDLMKKQYASKDQMAEVEQEIAASQDRIKASDLKLQYLNQLIALSEAERRAAEAHVATAQTLTEQAKYRAMKAGNAPEAGSVNPGEIDQRVASAQAQEANLLKEVAGRRTTATGLYNRWQQADARARSLARPSQVAVPPPTSSEPTPH
jgi:chromosome segregation ATPase